MCRWTSPWLRSNLARCERGVSAIEFALIAPVFLTLLLGTFDVGHTMYVRGILSGAIQDAGRDAGLESGANTVSAIDTYVAKQLKATAPQGAVLTTRKNYQSFMDAGKPEDFVDANANLVYDPEECFTDANGNEQWDPDKGLAGQGGADDVVVYTATLTYDRIVPLGGFLGWDDTNTISASTVLRNQPFADQAARQEVQICPN